MKVFTTDNSPWNAEVNYVDKNNRVLGYSMSQDCCEIFGHCVLAKLPAPEGEPDDHALPDSVLEPYSFSPEAPAPLPSRRADEGSVLAFRIVADGLPDLWVVIWNFHNGYYSHGWEFDGKEGSL